MHAISREMGKAETLVAVYCSVLQRVLHTMEWLWLVGSLKTEVAFQVAKEPYEIDYILQKRPIFLRSVLIVATPYGMRLGEKGMGWRIYTCACV